jgi:hypothetical protein
MGDWGNAPWDKTKLAIGLACYAIKIGSLNLLQKRCSMSKQATLACGQPLPF